MSYRRTDASRIPAGNGLKRYSGAERPAVSAE